MKIVGYPDTKFLRADPSYLRSLITLDTRVFGELEEKDMGSEQVWLDVEQYRPDTEVVALDSDGHVIGYIDVFPVTSAAADLIKSGLLGDGEIRPNHIAPVGSRGFALYIMTIAVDPSWRRRGIAKALWNSSLQHWKSFGAVEVFATIWSAEGERFFSPIRDSLLSVDGRGHPTIRLRPLPF